MTTTYHAIGPVCGSCGHHHRSIAAAEKCCRAHAAGCRSQGGYSDRCVERCDGARPSEQEIAEIDDTRCGN